MLPLALSGHVLMSSMRRCDATRLVDIKRGALAEWMLWRVGARRLLNCQVANVSKSKDLMYWGTIVCGCARERQRAVQV